MYIINSHRLDVNHTHHVYVFITLLLLTVPMVQAGDIGAVLDRANDDHIPAVDRTVIDMGSYTVDRPPGEGWKAVVTAKEQRIDFSRDTMGFSRITMGNEKSILLRESIMVKTQWARDKNIWKLSEQEVAKKYFERERAGLERAVLFGMAKTEHLNENILYIDDRKLYNFYSKQKITNGNKSLFSEQSMYLYFPPGYKNDDKFMVFLVTEAYEPGSRESADLSEILPVIKSLKINLGKLNE